MNAQHLGQVCAHARAALRSLETATHMAGDDAGMLLGDALSQARISAQTLLSCAEYERTQAEKAERAAVPPGPSMVRHIVIQGSQPEP